MYRNTLPPNLATDRWTVGVVVGVAMGVAGLRKNVTENGKQQQQKIFNGHHQNCLPIILQFRACAEREWARSTGGNTQGISRYFSCVQSPLLVCSSCLAFSLSTHLPSQTYVCSNLSICIAILVSNRYSARKNRL